MNAGPKQRSRGWPAKFRDAGRGILAGVRGQSSFYVHLPAALAVIALAGWLRVSIAEWGLLLLCVATVLAAELFNSALEALARALDARPNEHIRDALDIAGGAVLLASLGAVAVGLLVFLPRIASLLAP